MRTMKTQYVEPEMQILKMDTIDIIRTSGGGQVGNKPVAGPEDENEDGSWI